MSSSYLLSLLVTVNSTEVRQMLVLQKTQVTGTYYYTDKNKGGNATTSIKRAKQFKSVSDIDNYFHKVADEAKLPDEWERARKEIRNWRKYHLIVEV